ncbi:hypothetical protein [Aeromonas hydrophila]|uniref:hypothetical protein n=1 Tax=Aeromonas hydrophila TaxID=644 RepID=UPI00068E6B0C|nr:hypothetical protein [Aeromonas hydrophila]OFC46919.1 hypothetical protein BA189_10970 [Aeromonas hydrophila]OFC55134.1 hypothetical protein BA188_04155 [Aeromonas hydrophila]
MTMCQCPACRGRISKWTTTPPGWTDTNAGNSQLPALPEHLLNQQAQVEGANLGQQCKAEDNNMADGVFLWVETHSAGHAFLSIHSHGKPTVYTYGRYGDMPPGFPLIGEGILLRMINSPASGYLKNELYKLQAQVFKVLDVDKPLIEGYLSGVYMSSDRTTIKPDAKPNVRQFGKVIDQYDLTGNNCTTHSVKALRFGGSRIFDRTIVGFTYSDDFTIPGSLLQYMTQVSADVSDLRAIEVTAQMKEWFPNTSDFSVAQESGEDKAMGSIADTAGSAGSSTGYAGGTIGGSLGGSYETKNF